MADITGTQEEIFKDFFETVVGQKELKEKMKTKLLEIKETKKILRRLEQQMELLMEEDAG